MAGKTTAWKNRLTPFEKREVKFPVEVTGVSKKGEVTVTHVRIKGPAQPVRLAKPRRKPKRKGLFGGLFGG